MRTLRTCTLLLLAATLVNLLVAWGLTFATRFTDAPELKLIQTLHSNEDGVRVSLFSAEHQWFGVHERQFYRTRRSRARPVPKRISVYWTWLPRDENTSVVDAGERLFADFKPQNPDKAVISNIRAGFPALCLEADTLVDDSATLPDGRFPTSARDGFFDPIDTQAIAGKPGVWSHAQHLWFPYRPIWTGMAVNILFYALILAGVAWTLAHIRWARRMLRGRCPRCAYELHHDFTAGCPECGWRREPNRKAG